MESSINSSPVLDRERRKRIQRSDYVFEFSTNLKRAVRELNSLSNKIDEARAIIAKNDMEIFKTPYKDWRTND
jgi:hypothetical protein